MKERSELVICLLALNSIPSLPCLALFCRELYPASCLRRILPTDFQLDPSSGRHWRASGRWEEERIHFLPLSASCCASVNGSQFWQGWQQAALGSSSLCSSSSGIRRLSEDAAFHWVSPLPCCSPRISSFTVWSLSYPTFPFVSSVLCFTSNLFSVFLIKPSLIQLILKKWQVPFRWPGLYSTKTKSIKCSLIAFSSLLRIENCPLIFCRVQEMTNGCSS